MQKILVTGSEGLIGKKLVRALESDGADVWKLDLRCRPGGYWHGDVRNHHDIQKLTASVDGIIHLAAISRVTWSEDQPDLCWNTNLVGTKNVLAAARRRQVKPWVIVASSREVYGAPESFPVAESAPLAPVNVYGRAKVGAERVTMQAREAGVRTAILRFSNVYGSIDDHADRVVPAFARGAATNGRLRIDGREHTFDFTHVDDTVSGILAARDLLAAGESNLPPIHLLTGRPTTLGELANLAVSAAGTDPWIVEAAPRDFDVSHFWGDPSRAGELLGWKPEIRIEDGVRRLVEDFQRELEVEVAR